MSGTSQKEFTGRHMLLIMIVFFGVIIAVNITMAVVARQSWTGLVAKNTYVASQQFNQKMADTKAQAALHWSGSLTVRDGAIGYRIADASSQNVPLKSVSLKFMRPVGDHNDWSETLTLSSDGGYRTIHPVADGVWLVAIEADAGLDKPFRETLRINIVGGARK